MNSPERKEIEKTPSSQRNAHPPADGSESRSSHVTRRVFCNELLLTSTGILLAAGTVAAEPAIAQEPLLAYPPMKIEGAERLIVELQMRSGGQVWAIGKTVGRTEEKIAQKLVTPGGLRNKRSLTYDL